MKSRILLATFKLKKLYKNLTVGAYCLVDDPLLMFIVAEMARQQIPLNKDARATNILLITHMELEHLIRGQFMTAWNGLVRVKPDKGKISIYQKRPHVIMDMSTALKGLQRFEDVGEAARKLCDDIETILIGPRTDIHNLSPHSIKIDNVRPVSNFD